ncbi:MAG TPA: SDR family oxidoreductase [Burkholderiales bacterium]|nr:SDR family oxidoreductase [Burkholderiales bacterium]
MLFGASGAIGQAVAETFMSRGWSVTGVSRSRHDESVDRMSWIVADPENDISDGSVFDGGAPYQAVCWAQGANLNDSVYDIDETSHLALYKINCLFILTTLKLLLQRRLLSAPARLCVVSSIWQNLARQNKLSYAMTKAALQGLVLSAAADLAAEGHLINAVLPGALDTPMTRANLTSAQVSALTSATRFGRLPHLEDVANLAYFLCSEENTGITAQFIAADLGFSHVRIL